MFAVVAKRSAAGFSRARSGTGSFFRLFMSEPEKRTGTPGDHARTSSARSGTPGSDDWSSTATTDARRAGRSCASLGDARFFSELRSAPPLPPPALRMFRPPPGSSSDACVSSRKRTLGDDGVSPRPKLTPLVGDLGGRRDLGELEPFMARAAAFVRGCPVFGGRPPPRRLRRSQGAGRRPSGQACHYRRRSPSAAPTVLVAVLGWRDGEDAAAEQMQSPASRR